MKFIPNEEYNSELFLTKEDLRTPNLSIEEVLSARPWVILTKEAHQAYVDAAVVTYTDGSKSFKMKNAFGHAKQMAMEPQEALGQFIVALQEAGFEVFKGEKDKHWGFVGGELMGSFAVGIEFESLNNKVVADYILNYTSAKTCPFVYEFPTTEKEINYIVGTLKFLSK